jgi:hypothetical protein
MSALSSFLSAVDVYIKNLKSVALYTLFSIVIEFFFLLFFLIVPLFLFLPSFSVIVTVAPVQNAIPLEFIIIILVVLIMLLFVFSNSLTISYNKSLYELYSSNKQISSSSAKEFFLNILKFLKKSFLLLIVLGSFSIAALLLLYILYILLFSSFIPDIISNNSFKLESLVLFFIFFLPLIIFFILLSLISQFSFISLAIKNLGVIDTLKDAFSFMSRRFISIIKLFGILFLMNIGLIPLLLFDYLSIVIIWFISSPISTLSFIILYVKDMEKLKSG